MEEAPLYSKKLYTPAKRCIICESTVDLIPFYNVCEECMKGIIDYYVANDALQPGRPIYPPYMEESEEDEKALEIN